ncbi:hypothetical protein PHISP_08822, partial [Aspergillus sp. HF37]
WPDPGMDHRNPCPCRPPVRRALYPGGPGRPDRDRRWDHGRAGHLRQDLQRGYGIPARRQPVRRAVQGWRRLS